MTKYILIYFIIFVSSVCSTPGFDYAKLKRYEGLPKQTWAISDPEHSARVILIPCLVVLVQFLGHSGPSWVSTAPSSGHLDPLTIPLSFCRESDSYHFLKYFFFILCLNAERYSKLWKWITRRKLENESLQINLIQAGVKIWKYILVAF